MKDTLPKIPNNLIKELPVFIYASCMTETALHQEREQSKTEAVFPAIQAGRSDLFSSVHSAAWESTEGDRDITFIIGRNLQAHHD